MFILFTSRKSFAISRRKNYLFIFSKSLLKIFVPVWKIRKYARFVTISFVCDNSRQRRENQADVCCISVYIRLGGNGFTDNTLYVQRNVRNSLCICVLHAQPRERRLNGSSILFSLSLSRSLSHYSLLFSLFLFSFCPSRRSSIFCTRIRSVLPH